jgi:hypothetical protein
MNCLVIFVDLLRMVNNAVLLKSSFIPTRVLRMAVCRVKPKMFNEKYDPFEREYFLQN